MLRFSSLFLKGLLINNLFFMGTKNYLKISGKEEKLSGFLSFLEYICYVKEKMKTTMVSMFCNIILERFQIL